MWVTWIHQDSAFSQPLSFNNKVDIFYERVWGWQLHIAELCLNGGKSHMDKVNLPRIPHSGFAAMQIMLSYFEMIAKYRDGFVPRNSTQGKSAKYFKDGVKSVFRSLASDNQSDIDSVLDKLYEARCDLYHIGQTQAGIVLTSQQGEALRFDPTHKVLSINPHKLPAVLNRHLIDFREKLLKIENKVLRQNFAKRFNYDHEAPTPP